MRLYPLGYPVDFHTASAVVKTAACENWRTWPALFDEPPLSVEIEVHSGPAPANGPLFEALDDGLRFSSDERNFCRFDAQAGAATVVVSEVLAAERRFRHHFLEALVLSALDSIFFTPLHAACVARDGRGTLLCGDSGAGKSSLAYACARRGWTFVSDDAFHLVPGPERIGVGGSLLIHLRGPARDLFPEIESREAQAAPNGKPAIEIDAAAQGFAIARKAAASQCVFLCRRPGKAAVRPFSGCAALRYFLKYIEPRDTRAAETHLREFLAIEPVMLEYESIENAVDTLEDLAQ